MDNQQVMALGMDMTNEELSWTKDELVRLERKMMSTIYSDGERVIKVFKKTQGWSTRPPEVEIQEFMEHLINLKVKVQASNRNHQN